MCDAPATARRCTAAASRARARRRGGGHLRHRRRGRLRAARRRRRRVGPAPPAPVSAARPRRHEFTGAQDALRTGWDPAEPGLAPKVLRSGRFGRVFTTRVRGQVYAQPLVVGRMVIAATEQDWVYGIDAVTGRVHWSVRLGHPGQAPGCPDLQPRIGITGTPVYDPRTRMVDVVAETTRRGGRHASYHLFAVNPLNGHVTRRVAIGGHPVNDPRLSFSAVKQLQRPALLLLGHWVLAAFGSHCDQPPYVGYVAAINPSTGRSRLWSDESGLTNAQGGIWQSGGGLMSDGPGRAFFASGNGISPRPGAGRPAAGAARRRGGPAGDRALRGAVGPGLLQPAGRPGAGRRGHRLRLRRPGRAAVRHPRAPAPAGAGGQGRPGVPAQPGPPGRPGAGTGRRGRGGQPGRPVRRPVGPPGGVRRHPGGDAGQLRRLPRLRVLPGPATTTCGTSSSGCAAPGGRCSPTRGTARSPSATPPGPRWSPRPAPTPGPRWSGRNGWPGRTAPGRR